MFYCNVCKHRLLSNVDLNIRKNKKHGENIPIFCTLRSLKCDHCKSILYVLLQCVQA